MAGHEQRNGGPGNEPRLSTITEATRKAAPRRITSVAPIEEATVDLLALVLDGRSVDLILGQYPGTAELLLADPEFLKKVVLRRQWLDHSAKPDIDFRRALTPRQVLAATALAEGRTRTEAAEAAGVTDRTIRNW